MYNPYLPQSWEDREGWAAPPPPPPHEGPPPPPPEGGGILGSLSGLLDRFHLRDLDTGDLILMALVLLLYLDDKEDNLELILTLGLMLIL